MGPRQVEVVTFSGVHSEGLYGRPSMGRVMGMWQSLHGWGSGRPALLAEGTAVVQMQRGKVIDLFSEGLLPPDTTPEPAPQIPALYCFTGLLPAAAHHKLSPQKRETYVFLPALQSGSRLLHFQCGCFEGRWHEEVK